MSNIKNKKDIARLGVYCEYLDKISQMTKYVAYQDLGRYFNVS